MLAWPSSSWIERRSAPPSSRWVANECLSVCGVTPGLVPARLVDARNGRLEDDLGYPDPLHIQMDLVCLALTFWIEWPRPS